MPRSSKKQAPEIKKSDAARKLVSKLASQINATSIALSDDLLKTMLSKAIDKIPNSDVKADLEENHGTYFNLLKEMLSTSEQRPTTISSTCFYTGRSSSREYIKMHAQCSDDKNLSVDAILNSLSATQVDLPHLAQTLLHNKSLFATTTASVSSLAQHILSLVLLWSGSVDTSVVFLFAFAIAHLPAITTKNIVSLITTLSNANIYSLLAFLSYWSTDEHSSRIASLVTSLLSSTGQPPLAADLVALLVTLHWAENSNVAIKNTTAKHFAIPSKAHQLITSLIDVSLDMPSHLTSAPAYINYCLAHNEIIPACRKHVLGCVVPSTTLKNVEEEPVVSFVIDSVAKPTPVDAGSADSVGEDAPTTSILESLGDFGKDETETSIKSKKKSKKRMLEDDVAVLQEAEKDVAPTTTSTKRTRKPRKIVE